VNQKIEDAVKSFEKNLEHYRKCIEDGNYSSSSSHVYFEKKQRAEEILNKCHEVNTVKIRKLLEEFETKLVHSQI
jgi:hypothetical protein